MSALDIEAGRAYEAHPVADLFPMLADDELGELAADITERGLLQPIILDAEGRILDGRNRLAACHLAGLEPRFETYDGDDPDGYALAVNIARRHLTKGQQAMIAARFQVTRNLSLRKTAKTADLNRERVRQAAAVLDHAPDLADSVVSGATSLDAAYDTARDRKRVAETTEAQMLKLRYDAPDLADLVTEERMSLADALAAQRERDRKQAEDRRDARALLRRAVDLIAPESASNGFVATWAEQLGDTDDELIPLIKRAEQAARVLSDLTERITKP